MARLGVAKLGRSKSRGYGRIEVEIGGIKATLVGGGKPTEITVAERIPVTISLQNKILRETWPSQQIELEAQVKSGAISSEIEVSWDQVSEAVEKVLKALGCTFPAS